MKGDNVTTGPVVTLSKPVQKSNAVVDTFSLNLNYTDPFLGKSPYSGGDHDISSKPKSRTSTSSPKGIVKQVQPFVKDVIDWSFLKFNGTIKNPNTNKMISMVHINNHQYMLGEGSTIEGVKVLKVYKDSLKVTYKNITKTITR